MKKIGILALVIGIALAIGSSAMGGPKGPKAPQAAKISAELRAAVTTKGIFKHLIKLQAIADRYDGTRAAGTPGFDVSANYVARKLAGYGWKVKRQPFEFEQFFQDAPSVLEQTAPATAAYAEDADFNTMDFSGSGDVTAELIAVDLTIPPAPEPGSSSGCEATDFDGLPVSGNVVLLQRGSCDFATKVDNATTAGAAAAVIFNEGQAGRTDIIVGTLGTPAAIPALDTSFALGSDLANGATNGPTGLTVHVATTTHSEDVTAENVIAETKGGDGDDVIMAGAHLDSVTEGPGINDNGTGSATLLETAKQISKLDVNPKNKIRFAWWGAEEEGLIGSTEYVAGLSDADGADIALYLNFDMIGSPNYARLIYDGNGSQFDGAGPEGSDAIERTFQRYFQRKGLLTGQTAFDGRSDYGPFIDVGIPAGGLFTGAEGVKTDAEQAIYGGTAGEAYDSCYHQACDTLENVNRRALGEMSDAVVHAVARYSAALPFIPRPESGAKGKRVKRGSAATGIDYLGDLLRR